MFNDSLKLPEIRSLPMERLEVFGDRTAVGRENHGQRNHYGKPWHENKGYSD